MINVCRPKKATCKWVKEITMALHQIEKSIPSIEECNNFPELIFDAYLERNQEALMKCDECKLILSYNLDYNEILCRDNK